MKKEGEIILKIKIKAVLIVHVLNLVYFKNKC